MDEFKFSIGDVVTHRAYLAEQSPIYADRLFVLERLTQQCPGGLQKSYLCRIVPDNYGNLSIKSSATGNFNEVELVGWAEWQSHSKAKNADA